MQKHLLHETPAFGQRSGVQSYDTMSRREDPRPTAPWGSPPSLTPSEGPGSQPPRLPNYVTSDIVAYVQRALGRFGTPGSVRWDNWRLVLLDDTTDGTSAVAVDSWAADWIRMDEESRRLRAEDVARTFSRRRAARASSLPPSRRIFIDTKLVALGLIFVLSLAWIFFGGADLPGSASGVKSASSLPNASPSTQTTATSGEARASRVCSSTLTRIFQGGSVSVADVDGFRVEIALLNATDPAPLHTDPVLKLFVEDPTAPTGSRFIWKEQSDLAAVGTSDSVVVVREMHLGESPGGVAGVVLSFGGSLVDAYFNEDGRSRYFHIASALSEQLHATHGAVYARCFDQPLHALGSWFRGVDTGAAVSALVYFMGTYARPLHLARPFTRRPGEEKLNRYHAFESIVDKTKAVTRTDLATLLGQEGGMATGRDGDQVLITFPFGDGNRASRASRNIVRVTGLGL